MLALGRARLQHGVVHGDVFALGIDRAKDLVELGRAVSGGDGSPAAERSPAGARGRRWPACAPTTETCPSSSSSCPRPQTPRPVLVGLLDKAAHVQGGVVAGVVGGLDVAVAGFGAGRLNAQHHDVVAGGGHGDALLQRLQEARLVGDHVVGGKDAQHRIGVLPLDQEGGQSAGRGGVARHRLLDDLPGGHALQLVGDLVGQVLVGDDPGLVQRRPAA
jgi:hypothetical protein